MKLLVIGGGGREHALVWKFSQSARRPRIYCAPGNAGTARHAVNVPIDPLDFDGLIKFAGREKIDLTVVGPEAPLCAGVVDRFQQAGLRIFGPTAAAARIEGDKAHAKQLMRSLGIPTAEARIFGPTDQELAHQRELGRPVTDYLPRVIRRGYDMAREFVATRDEGVVVKACGLAAGKGVFVHPDPAEALLTLERLMVQRELGAAGDRIIIEELLQGREVSITALVDGRTIYLLEPVADYKRLGAGNVGPNTGGMGACSPCPQLSQLESDAIQADILVPLIDALRSEEIPYQGVLYVGIMLTTAGPKVLEFNCRLGDPEAQTLMVRLQSDLLEAVESVVEGRLDNLELTWDERAAVTVVLASKGYPGEVDTGQVIEGLTAAASVEGVQIFHAGTRLEGDRIVTAGGRVLNIAALGDSLEAGRNAAYVAAGRIEFEGKIWREDIGAG